MSSEKYTQVSQKIARHITQTLEYCHGKTQEDFLAEKMLQEACVFNVLQIGELAAKAMELGLDKERPDIEWHQMRGMRNRIVHNYDGIRLSIVWDTISEDFPQLLKRL